MQFSGGWGSSTNRPVVWRKTNRQPCNSETNLRALRFLFQAQQLQQQWNQAKTQSNDTNTTKQNHKTKQDKGTKSKQTINPINPINPNNSINPINPINPTNPIKPINQINDCIRMGNPLNMKTNPWSNGPMLKWTNFSGRKLKEFLPAKQHPEITIYTGQSFPWKHVLV